MTESVDRDDRPVEPLMTLSEAAAVTGRQPESIRTLIRRGKLQARKGNDGRWLVAVPVEMRRLGADRAVTTSATGVDRPVVEASADHGQAVNKSVEHLSARVAELEATAAELRLDVEHWRERAEQDALARARTEGALEAAERAHAAEIAALRELVAELRRPWWRRMVGK